MPTLFDYVSPDRSQYNSVKITSRYLTMPDGVRLAVDVIFPQPYDFRKPLPTLLHQTRYWRRPKLRAPWRWFLSPMLGHEGKLVQELVMSGFAFVNVDARGSGASFGTRAHPWTAAEVNDGVNVVDWIVDQAWSNGKVGAVGISYTGTAAEFLATRNHLAVKALMPLFSLYDVYDDIALPGGIPHDGFVKRWGQFNEALDRNAFPLPFPIAKALLQGVAPVKGAENDLPLALAAHQGNLSVADTAEGILYRDQAPANGLVESMDEFSPHQFLPQANAAETPCFSGSGWFDGAYQHAAIKRHLNLQSSFNKLLIGPWEHGGKFHITPGQSGKSKDKLVSMPIQYFDHFLKGLDTPVTDLAPVNYFTMQAERWNTADQWPPKGTQDTALFFRKNGSLKAEARPESQYLPLKHRPETGTGEITRWRCLVGLVTTHKFYPDRKDRTRELMHFDSAPLGRALEVTGHPIAELWIKTQAEDGSFFVYMDDIAPDGSVYYVTEGQLRATHREIATQGAIHTDCVPQRSYKRADEQPIPKGLPFLLRIDLLPTSYLFRPGHRIRISIATADKDNFADLTPAGAEYALLLGGEHASRLVLPVMA